MKRRCLAVVLMTVLLPGLAPAAGRTPETAAFYGRLKAVADEGRFFYSFDAPWCNRHDLGDLGICREAGRVPQLYFLEFYYVAGTWRKPDEYAANRERLTKTVKDAYAKYGSVPVFSWHPENPYADRAKINPTNSAYAFPYRYRYATEGYPQEHRYVIREILEGHGFAASWYEARLKEIAAFLKGLTDAKGRPIPTVVRLFHECEDDWHWWGRESVKVADYISFWRLTVTRLRELTGGGDNLLFLYSPDRYWNKVGEPGKRNYDLLSRYAGDEYVDIIGFDDYTVGKLPSAKMIAAGTNAVAYMEGRLAETVRKFRLMSAEAKRRGKPCGLVETGFSNGTSDDCCTAWVLKALKSEGVALSFVNTWSGNTVPESAKGFVDWKRFVNDPAVVMADIPAERRTAVVPAPQEMRIKSGWYATRRTDVAKAVGKWTADATLPKEGYAISVTQEGIVVRFADEGGRFWAVETLRQLAEKTADGLRVPCARIRDWPRYGWRGIHLDECRHFFGKDEVKKILDLMTMHRLNVFHWHLTEDQAWRLEIPGYPDLVKYGAIRPYSLARGATNKEPKYDGKPYGPFFYTVADAKEIVEYAKARHITVVPEIELPGHARAALAAYPELSCVGASLAPRHPRILWGIEDDVFCAGNDETIRFLEKVFDTVCDIFPSETIHIGGDECPKARWKACAKCQARMKAEGLKDEEALQAWMTRHFLDYLAKKGRRAIGWDEILSSEIPSATRVMAWHTRQPNRVVYTAEDAVKRGHETVATPMARCYIDSRQGVGDERYEFPKRKVTLANIFGFDPAAKMTADEAKLLIGVQACNWTERTWGKDDLEWKMWPRACALAEVAWTASPQRDYAEFVRRLERHRPRLLAVGVNCAPLKEGK